MSKLVHSFPPKLLVIKTEFGEDESPLFDAGVSLDDLEKMSETGFQSGDPIATYQLVSVGKLVITKEIELA